MMSFTKFISSVQFLRGLNSRCGFRRCHSSCQDGVQNAEGMNIDGNEKGLVLGVYETDKQLELTAVGEEINQKSGGKISQHLNLLSSQLKLGKAFVVTDVAEYGAVALAGLGPREPGVDELEALDLTKENVRWAVGAGVRALRARGCGRLAVDAAGQPEAAAQAAELAAWRYGEFKSCESDPPCEVEEYGGGGPSTGDGGDWAAGKVAGAAQNWARLLSDTPANVMRPEDLAQAAIDTLCPLGVAVDARDRSWIQAQGMEAFLAVSRGSCAPPMFIECVYRGAPSAPVLLAAKGVTFDSGGLCLKPCEGMVENRGSMAGAAVVLAAIKVCAELKVPISLHAVIPACENMVSGQCMKVGDVLRARDGTSILVEDTDLEGRLLLADALLYGQSVASPRLVIDVATLTRGVALATGGGAYGCFTRREELWQAARAAGSGSGERPWRLPLWTYYSRQLTDDPAVDLRNRGSGKASPCLGAAFLERFVSAPWLHWDITGVGKLAHGAPPYLSARRMSGRPARALAALLHRLAAPADLD